MTEQNTRRTPKLLGLIAGAVVAVACQGGAVTPSSDDVWALVDGREIRRDEVEQAYRTTVDPNLAAPSNEESLALKLDILEELITQDLLMARARELGLEASDSDVEAALAERREAITPESFDQQLEQSGLTLDQVKLGLRRELSVQRVVEREVLSKIAVTDQEVTDYYEQNREQFNLPEPQYRLAQIVVTPEANPNLQNRTNSDAATAAEARQKVEMLTTRLKEGTDFGELALDYSEDPQSVMQGGDVGFVPESALAQLSPQLRDAVREMEPGTVNAVNLGGTYMILMLLAEEPAGQRDLETPSVRDGIRDMLTGRKETLLQAAYITTVRDQADVTNFLARRVVDAQGELRLPPSPLAPPSATTAPAATEAPAAE